MKLHEIIEKEGIDNLQNLVEQEDSTLQALEESILTQRIANILRVPANFAAGYTGFLMGVSTQYGTGAIGAAAVKAGLSAGLLVGGTFGLSLIIKVLAGPVIVGIIGVMLSDLLIDLFTKVEKGETLTPRERRELERGAKLADEKIKNHLSKRVV